MYKNTLKIAQFARWENMIGHAKKNYINFYSHQKFFFFSETRVKFRHWVTGITRPSNRNILRHDLHDN